MIEAAHNSLNIRRPDQTCPRLDDEAVEALTSKLSWRNYTVNNVEYINCEECVAEDEEKQREKEEKEKERAELKEEKEKEKEVKIPHTDTAEREEAIEK